MGLLVDEGGGREGAPWLVRVPVEKIGLPDGLAELVGVVISAKRGG